MGATIAEVQSTIQVHIGLQQFNYDRPTNTMSSAIHSIAPPGVQTRDSNKKPSACSSAARIITHTTTACPNNICSVDSRREDKQWAAHQGHQEEARQWRAEQEVRRHDGHHSSRETRRKESDSCQAARSEFHNLMKIPIYDTETPARRIPRAWLL